MPPENDPPETGNPTPPPTPTPPQATPAATPPDRLPDDHPLVKAFGATKDELAKARAKVKEHEDATKSDHERLTETVGDLQGKLSAADANAVRFEIALDHGLTKSQAKRLVGTTREELEADAADLLADLGVTDGAKPVASGRPKEALKPGTAPNAEPEPDAEKIADSILSRGF